MSTELDIAKKCAAAMYEADASSKALGISIEVTGVGQAEARVEITPAIDAPGVRSVLKSAELAEQKGLAIVSGFCWRYHYGARAAG